MRKEDDNRLLSQEAYGVENNCNKDFFGVHPTIKEIIKVLIPNKDNPEFIKDIQIIGLFDAYGEGKSSLIKTLKEQYNKKFSFIEIDLWQYENDEIQHDFHKVFHQQKARYFKSQKALNTVYNAGQKVRKFKGVSEILATKRSFEIENSDGYFTYGFLGLRNSVRKYRKRQYKKGTTPVLIFENMDRLSIEKKVSALSSIYNYRDSFQSHIIIALDPDAIRNTTTYFESLVDKCFTTYMYLTPKTKYVLKQYIQEQLSKVSFVEVDYLVEMLLTQYPSSLRELNHCINTFVMSYKGQENIKLVLFLAVLQVHYPQLYKAISQNPYILKKFIHHANDTGFNGYSEYGIENEQRYKLNLLIKSLGDIKVDDKNILSILSPLNRAFLIKNDSTLDDWIVRIEFLRKAYLEKDVMIEIENFVKTDGYSFEEFDKFFSEIIKDRRTFINFFQSQNFEDIFLVLKGIMFETDEVSFLETILSYNLEEIDDYSFHENYRRTIELFLSIIYLDKNFSELLVQRMLENFQLTREMIEKGVVLESNEYLVTKLKQLSFVNKILYITYFFPTINGTHDTNSIETVNNIIESSIRDLDIKKLENIEQYKQNIIKNFYLKDIPIGRYPYAKIELLIDIIESTIFEQLSSSEKIQFYNSVFNNHELIKQEDFDMVVSKLSKLLYEELTIEDTDIMVEILIKVKALEMTSMISHLSVKKFVVDSLELYGKYDKELRGKLELFL